jgi:hypothetical protein
MFILDTNSTSRQAHTKYTHTHTQPHFICEAFFTPTTKLLHNLTRPQIAMSALTKEEAAAHDSAVYRAGAIGGVAGLGLGLAGVALASRRWPAFRQMTLPFKAFVLTSSGTFGLIILADRASRQFHTVVNPRLLQRDDENAAILSEARASQGGMARALAWARERRYKIVAGSWAASMGVALYAVSRNRFLTTAQKLVQARVYAQALTLVVLVATAALEVGDAGAGKGQWETVMVRDPADPAGKKMIPKRIHHELYRGQDQWRGESVIPLLDWNDHRLTFMCSDMVEAEEQRLAEVAAEKSKSQ